MSQFKLVENEIIQIPTPYILVRKGKIQDTYLFIPHGVDDDAYLVKGKHLATGFTTREEAQDWANRHKSFNLVVEEV